MSTYRTGLADIAVLTDEGWRGIPHVEEATFDGRRPSLDPLLDIRRLRNTYSWAPGDPVYDVPTAQPWTRSSR